MHIFFSREAIKENDEGLVESCIADIIQKAKRKRQAMKKDKSRLGMMRHLFIILDGSETMSLPDLKPTRMLCTVKVNNSLVFRKKKTDFYLFLMFFVAKQLLEIFVEEFFDQNPISQFGLILLKDKRADKLSELAGCAQKHIKTIKTLKTFNPSGEPSLQNGLDLALQTLKVIPSHASREVVVLMSSLTTCDPGDISETIDNLKQEGIRCSVVSLSAEIHICRNLTEQTGGTYGAVLDDMHFRDQLLQHVDPPPAARTQENSLIKMGFPHVQLEEGKGPAL